MPLSHPIRAVLLGAVTRGLVMVSLTLDLVKDVEVASLTDVAEFLEAALLC